MTGTKQQQQWAELNRRIEACRECGRLVEWCQRVAREKRAAYREWEYWGRPVANFGDPAARLLVVGLAPGAHGANRTGRMFTGDSSGLWLYRALAKAGFATWPKGTVPFFLSEKLGQSPKSWSRDDGLQLVDCAITAAVHCAPPDNMPTRKERDLCRPWLERTFDVLPLKVIVALGGLAWRESVREVRRRGWLVGRAPTFAHGAKVALVDGRWMLASYHPSRQNTNTRRLTDPMLDAVFVEARRLLKRGETMSKSRAC